MNDNLQSIRNDEEKQTRKSANKSNINRYMKKIYGIENNFKKPCLKRPLCASEIANYDLLDRHFLPNHEVVSKYQHLKFGSKKTFEEWKLDFQKNSKSSFRFYDSKKRNN
jgi:hypothetical protein